MPSIGKINGLCADYSQSTLNGRPYDKIYERILAGKDARFNQMMKRGGIPCELGHPTDLDADGNPRTETDPTKVAVILTKIRKSGNKTLVAEGEIMDTPNGRIFKALSEFYTFGLSSRGSYEVDDEMPTWSVEGPNGWNQDTYVFKGYDLVILPANANSMLSATEGIDSKGKKVIHRVARESIDVNLLAKASNVSEDQVEEALDGLFEVNPEAKKSEEVNISEMAERLDEENIGDVGEATVEEVIKEETGEGVGEGKDSVEPTLVANGEDVEKIKADLQTALDEVNRLGEESGKKDLEISSRDAEILGLRDENSRLQTEIDQRIAESEEFVEKFNSLKEMAQKLVESYKKAKEVFDGKNSSEEENKELESRLEESEKGRKDAEESLTQKTNEVHSLRKELREAKESLISAYSTALGVSTEAIKSSLGKNYTVSKIRPAAESIANQTSRLPGRSVLPVAVKRTSSATESFVPGDEIEREIYEMIKNN